MEKVDKNRNFIQLRDTDAIIMNTALRLLSKGQRKKRIVYPLSTTLINDNKFDGRKRISFSMSIFSKKSSPCVQAGDGNETLKSESELQMSYVFDISALTHKRK